MKEMTLATVIAVFEEMFGVWLFWGLVAAAAAITLAFVVTLLRDRGIESRKLVRAELLAPLGGILAVLFVMWVTSSGLRDIGGPVDWVVLLAIALAGAAGLTILGYVVQSLLRRRGSA